jgi:hypothetical protein
MGLGQSGWVGANQSGNSVTDKSGTANKWVSMLSTLAMPRACRAAFTSFSATGSMTPAASRRNNQLRRPSGTQGGTGQGPSISGSWMVGRFCGAR